MKVEFSLNFGKSLSSPPHQSIESAPAQLSEHPGTGGTLVALAKAMPTWIQQAQSLGQIAAVHSVGMASVGMDYTLLRRLADDADLIRLAIEAVKKAVRSQDWDLATESGDDPNPMAVALIEKPDGETEWDVWAAMVLEDILVCDNLCLFPWWKGGRISRVEVVDGDTVKVLETDGGRIPVPPAPAFEQVTSHGGSKKFTTDQLWFLPQNRRSKYWRGYSPTEQLAGRATINLHKILKDLGRWMGGGIPPALVSLDGVTPDELIAFQRSFDDYARSKKFESTMRFLPGGKALFPPPLKIDKEHEEILIRTIFYCFGVDPTGMVSQVNYSTADALQRWASMHGLYPWLYALQSIAGKILAAAGYPDHRLEWKAERDAEALAQKQARREDYKKGLVSWEALREEEGESTKAADIEGEHFFAEGGLSPFDPLAKSKPAPAFPFGLGTLTASQPPEGQNKPGEPVAANPAPPDDPDPAAAKAEVDRWKTVLKKALASGKTPKEFRSCLLSKAFMHRVETGIRSGAGLGSFDLVKVKSAEILTAETSPRTSQAMADLKAAAATYLDAVWPTVKAEALASFREARKEVAALPPAIPAPDMETWRKFVRALQDLFEAGVDDAGDLVGYGALSENAAYLYAKHRAGLLIGRQWEESLGQWVEVAASPWKIVESLRREVADLVAIAIRDGWGVGALNDALLGDAFSSEVRSLRIARTETAFAYNTGACVDYAAQGVTVVEVLDGTGDGSCDTCTDLNGEIWSVAYAMANPTEHPNCIRAFSPRPDLTLMDADRT